MAIIYTPDILDTLFYQTKYPYLYKKNVLFEGKYGNKSKEHNFDTGLR